MRKQIFEKKIMFEFNWIYEVSFGIFARLILMDLNISYGVGNW